MSAGNAGGFPSLEALESWMLSWIARPRIGARGDDGDARISDWLCPSSTLSAEQRLGIYADMYWNRLVECLEQDHPAVRAALGTAGFRRLAREFAACHPPRHFTLNLYGREFADFLGYEAEDVPERKFVTDLARLERALVDVFHERREQPLEARDVQAVPGDAFFRASLRPRAACRWFRFSHPVSSYLDAVRAGRNAPLPAPRDEHVLVLRRRQRVERHLLEDREYGVLDALARGRTLESALAELCTAEDTGSTLETLVAGWFQRWMALGVFARLELDEP